MADTRDAKIELLRQDMDSCRQQAATARWLKFDAGFDSQDALAERFTRRSPAKYLQWAVVLQLV